MLFQSKEYKFLSLINPVSNNIKENTMDIGTIAGKVWKTLEKKGAMSASALAKELAVNNNELLMALGWLLREDKLSVSKVKNATKYGLK